MDEKLEIFIKESVKCAFEAAFTSFSQTVGERGVVIESELEQLTHRLTMMAGPRLPSK